MITTVCVFIGIQLFALSSVAQSKSAHEKFEDDLYEMSKPLARYADDEDLETMLKQREREGDPMLAFIKKPRRIQIEKGQSQKKGWCQVFS